MGLQIHVHYIRLVEYIMNEAKYCSATNRGTNQSSMIVGTTFAKLVDKRHNVIQKIRGVCYLSLNMPIHTSHIPLWAMPSGGLLYYLSR